MIVSAPPANVQPVRGIAISPDKTIVAASRGSQIDLYNAATGAYQRNLVDPGLKGPDGKPIHAAHLALVDALAYSPDGKTIASGAYQEVILWDAATGALRKRITGFADRVVALTFPTIASCSPPAAAPRPKTARSRFSMWARETRCLTSKTDTVIRSTASALARTIKSSPLAGGQVRQDVGSAERQAAQGIRGAHASRP